MFAYWLQPSVHITNFSHSLFLSEFLPQSLSILNAYNYGDILVWFGLVWYEGLSPFP
jgi:hypothetical protein